MDAFDSGDVAGTRAVGDTSPLARPVARLTREMIRPTRGGVVFALLVATSAVIFLPGLGHRELKGEEERRILPAIDMMRSGDWVQPMLGGEPYHIKPPMINWIVAGSFLVTGTVNEWTARLPSVLGLVGFLAVLAFRPCRAFSPRARLFAGLVFLSNVGVWEKGRMIEIEALLIALTGAACVWWIFARLEGSSAWATWTVPCVLLSAGMLLKGPAMPLFFYALAGGVLLAEGRLRELLHPAHLAGVGVAFGAFLAWYVLSARETTHADVSGSLAYEAFMRFFVFKGFVEWLHVGARSFANFLPWIVCVPLLWRRSVVEGLDERLRRTFVGCRWGVVLPFLVLAWTPGSSARYTLPVIPVASLLLGLVFDRMEALEAERKYGKPALLVGLPVLCAVQLAGWVFVSRTAVSTVVLGVSVVAAVVALRRSEWFDRRIARAWGTAVVAALIGLGYSVFVTPLMAQRERYRPAAARVAAVVPEGEVVHVFDPGAQEFLFYLRQPFAYVLKPAEITPAVRYLVIRRRHLDRLLASGRLAEREVTELGELPARVEGDFRVVSLGE